ncbi:MAG TPA: hypothetical protein DCR06_11560 [Planctomycetaceae bacterium]|nr:hypothetical protein [Planctomycetaceae bacterium]
MCQGVQIAGFSSPPPEVSPPGVQSFPDSAAGATAGPAGDGAPPGPAGAPPPDAAIAPRSMPASANTCMTAFETRGF